MLSQYLILGILPQGGGPPPPVVVTPTSRTLVVGPLFCRLSGDFLVQPDGIPLITQAPLADAELDYCEDWSRWLSTGEEITAVSWEATAGLTITVDYFDETTATVWLTGGTLGQVYLVQATITTSEVRTDTRSFRVLIVNR